MPYPKITTEELIMKWLFKTLAIIAIGSLALITVLGYIAVKKNFKHLINNKT